MHHDNTARLAPALNGTGWHPGRLRRVFGVTTSTLLGLLALVVGVAACGPIVGWWHYEVVESGSMTPALRVGGVAVVQAEPLSAVQVGQIVAIHPPGRKNYVRIHRVITVSRHNGQVWVRTKGDANNAPDPGPIRLLGNHVYHETEFVPYVGYGAVWLYKRSTRVALTVCLFVLVVGGGLYLIWSNGDDAEDKDPEQLPAGEERPVPDLSADKAAEQAANASMLALNNIYSTGEADVAEGEADGAVGPLKVASSQPPSRSAG